MLGQARGTRGFGGGDEFFQFIGGEDLRKIELNAGRAAGFKGFGGGFGGLIHAGLLRCGTNKVASRNVCKKKVA